MATVESNGEPEGGYRPALRVFVGAVGLELVEVLNRLPPEERNRFEQRLVRDLGAHVNVVEPSERPVYRALVRRLKKLMTDPTMDLLDAPRGDDDEET